MSSSIKSRLAWLHRWTALLLAPVFVLILLSGAVLALKPVNDSRSTSVTGLPAATVAQALAQIDPAGKVGMATVAADGQSLILQSKDPALAGRWDIASLSKQQEAGTDWFGTAKQLHKNLLLGAGIVVEIACYAMIGIILVGLLLGWPKLRNTLMGWHMGGGWLLLPLVALTPVTGAMMALHIGTATLPPLARGGPPATLAQGLDAVGAQGDAVISVRQFKQGSVLLAVATADGVASRVVDRQGAVQPMAPGGGLVKQLHEGTWGGVWSGMLNLLAALALSALTVTGLYSWWRRWRLGARMAVRQDGDAGADTLVAFASQTGTAAKLADATAAALRDAGLRVACTSLAAVRPDELAGYRRSLLIVSSCGEGEVPDQGRAFVQALGKTRVDGAQVGVLALGDSAYPVFCGGGQTVRETLLRQGATELVDWQQADGDPAAAWREWLGRVADACSVTLGETARPELDEPVTLQLLRRERLDDPGIEGLNETWQIALQAPAGTEFRPGDLLLVSPGEGVAPRCYSIGSSSQGGRREIVLSVGLLRWTDADGNARTGHGSGYLCEELQPGAVFAASLRHHPGFHPPADVSRPLIMVAAGAGIAPFPGFLAERAQRADAGPSWLMFGNRKRNGDFFYRKEWENGLNDGTLARLDAVFSRDEGDGRYVDACLIEQGVDVLDWLVRQHGSLYTCGRASTVGQSVEAALRTIIARHGPAFGLGDPDATLAQWKADGTLRVDVFG